MNKYFNLFDLKQKVNYKTEVLSGLTVAMALVPEAVAFALRQNPNVNSAWMGDFIRRNETK